MSKNKLYFLILVSVGINIGTWIYFFSYKQNNDIMIKSLQDFVNNTRSIEKITEININNSGVKLDDFNVKDSLGTFIPIKKYFSHGKKYLLINRFSEHHCSSCVSHSIKMIHHKINSLKKENVLFLGNYRNNKVFNQLKKSYSIDTLNVGNVNNNFNIPAEELRFPYYFVIDSSLNVLNLFVPDKGSPRIDDKYLDLIKTKFFSPN